jgi:Ca-activated chloride channel family protein
MTWTRNLTLTATLLVALAFIVSACGVGDGGTEPLDQASAEQRVAELANDIGWLDAPVTRKASVAPPEKQLADTLPDIDEFDLVVNPPPRGDQVVAEIFASTEKSGSGTDGWMVEAAESFNSSNAKLADGRDAKVAIRKIPSGTGYQFVAAGDSVPAGFSPSNQLWIEMASTHSPMSRASSRSSRNRCRSWPSPPSRCATPWRRTTAPSMRS